MLGTETSVTGGMVMAAQIVCFGEVLLRLGAPGRQLLLQSPQLDVHVGGAEANVAVSLARLGHRARLVSVLPKNALGEAAAGELRRYGVDDGSIRWVAGRMGLYFLLPGAIHRPSEVLYDRAHSAFALASASQFDWELELSGAEALHVSGITPALGPELARATFTAIETARRLGLRVSFDINYRPRLWRERETEAPKILGELLRYADTVFADDRDMALILGERFESEDPLERIEAAARMALDAYPGLSRFACTIRSQHSVDHHALSAVMVVRDADSIVLPAYEVVPIVDRIGSGDAFAAGLLHGLYRARGDLESLGFALAAACLKHSLPGDFNLLTASDIEAFLGQQRFDVRR